MTWQDLSEQVAAEFREWGEGRATWLRCADGSLKPSATTSRYDQVVHWKAVVGASVSFQKRPATEKAFDVEDPLALVAEAGRLRALEAAKRADALRAPLTSRSTSDRCRSQRQAEKRREKTRLRGALTCAQCKRTFQPHIFARRACRFCSAKCRDAWKNVRAYLKRRCKRHIRCKTCTHCGQDYRPNRFGHRRQKYCSHSCKTASASPRSRCVVPQSTFFCEQCATPLVRSKTNPSRKRFCGDTCKMRALRANKKMMEKTALEKGSTRDVAARDSELGGLAL